MKRFWNTATVAPADHGYAVLLDGRPMHLPAGPELRIRSRRLAEAVAAEWQQAGAAKGGEMSFADTPLTRLAGTAQQRVAPDPAPTADAIARYAEHDLLCYRATSPDNLVRRQARAWQPWLDWAALAYDAPLRVTALGSLVLGLALAEGRLDAPTAHALGVLDELFETEQWGEDAEAAARRAAIAADIALAARFIALSKEQPP
jgi:chaperone required for assembly of F1-ATPase